MKDPELPADINEDTAEISALAKAELVNSNVEMGLRLIDELYAKGDPNNNVVITPFGLGWSLGLLMDGAENNTSEGIYTACQLKNLSQLDINQLYQGILNELLIADPSVTTFFGNGIWVDDNVELSMEFTSTSNQFYNSQHNNFDFDKASALSDLNQWVSNHTNSQVSPLLDNLDPNTKLMLISSFFYRARFVTAFDTTKTHTQFFSLPDGSKELVNMMYHRGVTFQHYEDPLLEIADLPYGNGRFHLTVVLPKASANLDAIIKNATAEDWNSWIAALEPKSDIELQLPRFEMNYKVTLDEALSSLGMSDAYSDAADFSAMSQNNLVLNRVEMGASMAINESGYQAPPEISNADVIEGEPNLMVVNKPFLIAVREVRTGAVVLMAKVVNPEFN